MFNYISAHKNAYRKGQLFPFMLAVVVVLLIMLIITINLGQLSVFKTDTSNAADGGALAGASSISSSLLGLGNSNDMMAGEAYVCLCMAIGFFCTYVGIAAGIALLITHISKSVLIFVQEMGATIEGLAKARQNAIQYAWQNIGVDEPRPSMGMFLYRILEQMNRYDPGMSPPGLYNYGIFDSTTHRYFSEYAPYTDVSKQGTDIRTTPAQLMQDCLNNRNGCTVDDLATFQHIYETGYDDNPAYQIKGLPSGDNDPNIRYQFKVGSALKSDFSNFMSDDAKGWWQWGKITINNPGSGIEESAYAWNNDAANINGAPPCYDGGEGLCGMYGQAGPGMMLSTLQLQYDNIVTVNVQGPTFYDLYLVQAAANLPILSCLEAIINRYAPDWLKWIFYILGEFLEWFINWVFETMSHFLAGYPIAVAPKGEVSGDLPPNMSPTGDPIYDHPVTVKVTRYKKDSNLGLWKMTYGVGSDPSATKPMSSVMSYATVALSRKMPKDDPDIPDSCASVLPSCCYTCMGGTNRTTEDPFTGILCGVITDAIDGVDIEKEFTNFFNARRHLFEAIITEAH